MKKVTKIAVTVGIILIILGGITFGIVVMVSNGKGIAFLSNAEYKTETLQEIDGECFSDISVSYSNADMELVTVDDGPMRIEYSVKTGRDGKTISEFEIKKDGPKLIFKETTRWHLELFSITTGNPKVKVFLPKDRLYVLKLHSDNGKISMQSGVLTAEKVNFETNDGKIDTGLGVIFCSGSVAIKSDNGAIDLGKIEAEALEVETDNGKITLGDVNVSGKVDVEGNNGSVTIGDLTAKEIVIEIDNGEIKCTDGEIDADVIKLKSDNGRIRIRMKGKKEDYTAFITSHNSETNIESYSGGAKTLTVKTNNGGIAVYFNGK
ncbi:MAG: DUF4097 domain-containing protein [Clostridia bacterium]|nr:DUF4097 domain-containing protein [Clostridia bacterium]